jgi:two-component system chemotaxis response regulator CheB
MSSIGQTYGARALCIIMTGMGSDGLEGVRTAKKQGSYIMAQSEDSCTIYGMPKAVIANHLQHEVVSLTDIGRRINQLCIGD